MAPKSTILTTKVESGSPYQLNHDQVLKASTALLKHISSTEAEKAKKASAQNLLAENDDDNAESTPICASSKSSASTSSRRNTNNDRVITLLPKLLGKTFYKSTTKRPIPISIQAEAPRSEGKRIARAKGEGAPKAAEPKKIAAEVEKAISSALVTLSSSTNSAIRIGYASWDAAKLAENLEVVVNTVIEKYVPKKWRGVRGIHVKGPETMSLPIWLADELWVEEEDVLDESVVKEIEEKAAEKKNKKRKSRGIEGSEVEEKGADKKQKLLESNDDKLDKEIALRKEMLKRQKEDAARELDAVPVAVKKSKKAKKTAA
ncbi:hypothetical protein EYC84_011273 [Monilinia fructicola]|uniref:Ribosomal protein L1 n=1 Tax=Monilinia fructicola TaxID=38448 RepID=A0A5M9J8Z4_MONFR|nr:hypothetical protein EYC84_011273 [Monilinia fructicola]